MSDLTPISFDDNTEKENKSQKVEKEQKIELEELSFSLEQATDDNSFEGLVEQVEDTNQETTDVYPTNTIQEDDDYVPVNRKSATTLANKDSNFICSVGTGGSGKSVILASLLYAIQTEYGVLNPKIGAPHTQETMLLLNKFYKGMSTGQLPERTILDKVSRLDFVFKPNNKSEKVPAIDLTFLETAGDNWNEVLKNGVLHSSIENFITADIPITFMLITGCNDAHKDDVLFSQVLFYLTKRRYNLKNTNVILIISKWDKMGTENVESEEVLDNFVIERLPMTHNYLETYGLTKTYYTVGELQPDRSTGGEKIQRLNLDSARRLAKWIYKSIVGYDLEYQGTLWEQIKWSLGIK